MNGADIGWMIVATGMVRLMTPALAFFYGGLVRSKNVLNTMMMSYIALGFVAVAWAFIGYSLAFSEGTNWIGDMSFAFLNGVGAAVTINGCELSPTLKTCVPAIDVIIDMAAP